MDEKGSRVKEARPVDLLPAVRRCEGAVALPREGKRGRTESEDIEDQRLAVAGPSIPEKSRAGLPAVRDGDAAVAGPLPVRPLVQRLGERPDLALDGRTAIEVGRGGQRPREKERRVHRGKLALPRSPPGPHLQEVV